jgi:tetratricopeptide (TPR) repeat protein
MIPLGSVRTTPAVVPAAIGVVLLLVLAASDGGYYATTWYPVGLGALALLVVTALALGPPRDVPRTTLAAALLLALFAGWAFLSITWADQQGLAWEGANRAGLYCVLFILFGLWPLRGAAGAWLVGAFALGVAGIGFVELLRAAGADDPSGYFVDARLAEPVGYTNANAALWTLAVWPCAAFAARRELHPLVRGICLGSSGLLLSLSLMTQSRGWVVALPIAALVLVAAVPGRVRTALALLATAAGTAAISGSLVAVRDDADTTPLRVLISDASDQILLMSLVLAVLGTLAALADRRVEPTEARLRATRIGAAVATAVAVVAGAVALVVAVGDPIAEAGDAWNEFKTGGNAPVAGSSRLTSADSNRYDFWTVAWDLFEEEPVRGIGVENFQAEYLKRGQSGEQPRFPHSLPLAVLSQTGLVGALLLGGALAAAVAAALGGVRRADGLPGAAAAAALALFAYWFAHASVDWLWEFPALAGAALSMLALAGALGRPGYVEGAPPERAEPERPRRRAAASLLAVLLVVAAGALAISVVLPWLAQRNLERAADVWRSDPDEAYDRLDRAADLNPLSPSPHLTAATIALELNQRRLAEREFRRALERDPESSYALLELGAMAAESGRRARAVELLSRARRLSPLDDLTASVLEAARRGEPMSVEALNREILARARQRAE